MNRSAASQSPPAAPPAPAARRRPPFIHPAKRVPLLMMLPALIVLVGVGVFPLGNSLRLAMSRWTLTKDPAPVFAGAENIREMLADPRFGRSLQATTVFTVGAVSSELVVGLALALLLAPRRRFTGMARTILLIPMMMTPVVVSMYWRYMLNGEFGVVKYLLSLAGIDAPIWTGKVAWAMPTIIAIDAWQWTPFVYLILLAGLQSLPLDVMEAARIDGASTWQRFWRITLPLLTPFIYIAALLRFMDAFRSFDIVFVLTGGGPADSTLLASMYVYMQGLRFFNMGYAAALSYVIVLIVLAAAYVFIRLEREP